MATPIKALDFQGNEFWWTGKAGQAWISQNRGDAFIALSLEGARAKALQFNRMSSIHGLHFVAVCGEPVE